MIDILLATFNGEKYLAQQIDSIIMQTYQNWRLLIRDDHSTDNTVSIINNYIKNYPNKIFLMDAFRKMNLKCFEPFGAFYVFPCIKEFGMTSEEFATRFLKEEKVAVVPGTAFGDCGEGFLRISYAYSLENLKVAIGRLEKFVEKLRKE